jgi:AcrR family transcriptional regulator
LAVGISVARRKIDISLKKQAKQRRSMATVAAIVEAATYILRRRGPSGFTANSVAEKAGVNIASFYQYFPNKQAVLFHIARITWDRQLERLLPVLKREGDDHAVKLREFFKVEAAEADLRRALRLASVDLNHTAEFRALLAEGAALTRNFLIDALGNGGGVDLDFNVAFMVTLVTSFAERTTDDGASGDDLQRQADLVADMLVARFGIS